MKAFNHALCAVLVISLLFSLGGSVFAAEPQYQITQEFVDFISQADGVTVSIQDPTSASDGYYDIVRVRYEGNLSKYASNVSAIFEADGSSVQLMMYNLIHFSADNLDAVLAAVNDVNSRSTGVKFYADLSDNSVTAEFYQLLPEEGGAEVATHAFGFMIGLTDSVYEELAEFAQ